MKKTTILETINNESDFNVDGDGMRYFGMFAEIDGKIVYRTFEDKN